MFKQALIVAALVAAAPAAADEGNTHTDSVNGETVTITEVNFRGHPPFKRTRKVVNVTDVAALESQVGEGEMVEVTRLDLRGAPPFRRYRTTVQVVDVAALEEAGVNKSLSRRKAGHPPYGRH